MFTNVKVQLEIPWMFGLVHDLLYVILKNPLFSELMTSFPITIARSNKDISAVTVFNNYTKEHLCFWSTFHLTKITHKMQVR